MMTSKTDFATTVIEALSHPFYVIDAETYQVKMANVSARHGELPAGITCHALTTLYSLLSPPLITQIAQPALNDVIKSFV